MTLPDPALVLPERHIERPMAAILDRPMRSHRRRECLPAQLPAQDVIAHIAHRLAVADRLADRHPDPLQSLPACPIRQALGSLAHQVRPRLRAPVTLLFLLMPADTHPCEV